MIPWQNFWRMIVGVVLALLFAFSSAQAHDIRPAYLELKETAPGQFSVLWRTPATVRCWLCSIRTAIGAMSSR